ncbi:polyketide synthase, partial [Paenibacillus sp. GbtcB18]|uniref:beta-ketoacyl synthase N-terminal-like domain-containing protein n=1 Tax=Paenibacillus sp. GbtcB18 TaxID=2824763 RepID=UPI001C2F9053
TFSVSEGAPIGSKPENEILAKPMEKDHQYSKPLNISKNWNQPRLTGATQIESDKKPSVKADKVAIIGMHCNFPDAPDLKQYWNNLISRKDSVREVPSFRWDWRKHYRSSHSEGYSISKWGAFVENIEFFDPHFFNIPNSLASTIDPLQRQWLEVSVQALSDAGYFNALWGKKVGVFVGTRPSHFLNKTGFNDKDILVGTSQNFIGAHLAHMFNFKGPNLVVDTACSSSLTAIHLAVKSIQAGESELALAGGVDLLLDEKEFLVLSNSKILSPNGRCKTFDASADGIALGEGCGVLVLKSLTKAIEDHDKIYGVIEGTAINNDGNTMGITTPDPESQCNLIEEAILNAAINPETISYIEAHGTGTLIGDPIELKGLTKAFRKYTDMKQFCGVGSVKSNIGHLLSASGAASIIKVILAILHKELPPTLHCEKPNERFKFDQSPFYLVQHPQKWKTDSNVLRAGISSFGLGGSNAHIIISNEGIPQSHMATLEPKNKRIEFNRSYYWPSNKKCVEAKDTEPSINDEDEFNHYFTISKLEDGRMNR